MSFIENVPTYIKHLEAEKNELFTKRAQIDFGDYGHECDCEYCDRTGEGQTDGDPHADKKAAKIDAQVAEIQDMIDRLTGKKPSLIDSTLRLDQTNERSVM